MFKISFHLKSKVGLLQTLSGLFQLVQFIKCWHIYLELNSKRLYQKKKKVVVLCSRLRVVPHFSSGIAERAKRERACKSPHARKARRSGPFLVWGDFQARSPFARSTIPEDKWGKIRSLVHVLNKT